MPNAISMIARCIQGQAGKSALEGENPTVPDLPDELEDRPESPVVAATVFLSTWLGTMLGLWLLYALWRVW